MAGTLIYDLLIILAGGLLAGLVCRRLRVSVLIGYLLVGVLLGKGLLGWVRDEQHEIEYIAEAGVFLLLFSIGIEFSLDEIWRLGRNLLVGGSVQMTLVAVPVCLALRGVGLAWQSAVLIAGAASFSSTVLVFKALSDSGHSSLPHGRRAIGILLFQDAALIPLLLLVPLLTGRGEAAGPMRYLLLAMTSVVFVGAVVLLRSLLRRWIIPIIASYRSPDLLVLFTLACLGGVTLAAYAVELPPAIGAFAAGLIFSGNRWSSQIDALVLPFRESFSAVFFVSLGLLFNPRLLWTEPFVMLGCLLGLIAVKALAATVALRFTGLRWRAASGMGVGLAHIGEFAFVLVVLGWEAAVISSADYQRIIALAIGSLILTPLLLKTGLHWAKLAGHAEPAEILAVSAQDAGHQAIVVGAGRIGRQVASSLETMGKDVCLVDFSPVNLQPFAQHGFRTVAGDASEQETLRRAAAEKAAIFVVCVPDDEAALRVVTNVRSLNKSCLLLVRCRYQGNVPRVLKAGANRVVSEEAQASNALVRMLVELDRQDRPDPA
jgi:CPA2 family monovalent cation:H+ antiporter-2